MWPQKNHTLIPVVCNTSSKTSLLAAVETIQKKTPFVNLLIANSGALGTVTSMESRPAERMIIEVQKELWAATAFEDAESTLAVNLARSYFTFIAFMTLLGDGNIHPESPGKSRLLQSQFITTSSFGGLCRNRPPSFVYSASKAALIHLTKTLSTEFAKYSIRVNTIAPGTYITEMTEVSSGFLWNLFTDRVLT